MPKTEEEILQEKIQNQFPEQLEANRERLCQSCVFWLGLTCKHGLLPMTSEGQSCPYYRRRE